MGRTRMKLSDKVKIPAVVEKIEYTTMGEISYKVEPLTTWFDADEIEALREKVQLSPETPTNSKTETVDTDLISRQAAIELACWRCKKCERKDCEYKDSCETMSLLEALPSEDPKPPVEPKRPKGEWIVYPLAENGRVELECPECGDTFIRAIDYRPHFCENCGADMRGEE